MTHQPGELLLLRLDALESDVAKVRVAVDRAKERGRFVARALDKTASLTADIGFVAEVLESLVKSVDKEPELDRVLTETTRRNLTRDLREAPDLLNSAVSALEDGVAALKEAKRLTVILNDEGLWALQTSLERRCDNLTAKVDALRREVATTAGAARRGQWATYQSLLQDEARPVFIDYVDFLGGLTVRDTGLDDQVCDMTDRLLKRYTLLIRRSLPLPAREAALGNVLDSVLLLGFPEWSIWGIPLVGHEVGLAYLRYKTDGELLDLAQKYVVDGSDDDHDDEQGGGHAPPPRSAELVHHLIADAFATYTLGLGYASAALLLRLTPRHDEPRQRDWPRDIDRARVIMMTLRSPGANAPDAGGSFSDFVGILGNIWESALRGYAGPSNADLAQQEMAGPRPEEDWIDDLTREAVEHFSGLMPTLRYDNKRWQGSEQWTGPLKTDGESPDWPYDDDITDVLTAAWRLRLRDEAPKNLADNIKQRWSKRQLRG